LSFKVSVIIPVYNCEKYISRSIQSVLAIEEVTELIIVDDGSTDLTFNICKDFKKIDSRIKIFFHEGRKNRGVSASRNLGIKNAKNNFIAFLDADDYYLPNRFKVTSECFAFDQSIEGVYEAIGVHNSSENVFYFTIPKNIAPESLFENLSPIGYAGWFHANGLTVIKSIFQKTGLFDEDLKTSEDTLLWLKIAATSKLIAGNVVNAVAVNEKTELSLSSNKKLVDEDQIRMLYKLYSWVNSSAVKGQEEKKELILHAIIELTTVRHIRIMSRYVNIGKLFFTIGLQDGEYIFRSKRIRRMLGNIIGLNK
jgi:glycosyltransferase involved in cell wall biosynthesis